MSYLINGLIICSGIGFILAVIGALSGYPILKIQPEGFSNGCTNLALLAIALTLCIKKEG